MGTDNRTIVRWLIAVVALLAVVGLLVWGDREAGVDDRDTDPEDVEVSSASAGSLTIDWDLG